MCRRRVQPQETNMHHPVPVSSLVVVVVIVLVGRLAELLPPEGDPDGHVAIQAEGHEGHRRQPPVIEVHVEHDDLFWVLGFWFWVLRERHKQEGATADASKESGTENVREKNTANKAGSERNGEQQRQGTNWWVVAGRGFVLVPGQRLVRQQRVRWPPPANTAHRPSDATYRKPLTKDPPPPPPSPGKDKFPTCTRVGIHTPIR